MIAKRKLLLFKLHGTAMCLKVCARSTKERSMVVIYRYSSISKGMYVFNKGRGLWLQREGSSKKMGPFGGSTLILKDIKGEPSLFFTVVSVNVVSYHFDVIFFVF